MWKTRNGPAIMIAVLTLPLRVETRAGKGRCVHWYPSLQGYGMKCTGKSHSIECAHNMLGSGIHVDNRTLAVSLQEDWSSLLLYTCWPIWVYVSLDLKPTLGPKMTDAKNPLVTLDGTTISIIPNTFHIPQIFSPQIKFPLVKPT